MTAQFFERLIYKGKKVGMASEPLSIYLRGLKEPIKTSGINTACWRGYVGTWEIKENRLYLTGIETRDEQGNSVGIEYIFPGQKEVFASWYSGELRIPTGELLEYMHAGYGSVFEKDIFLEIESGILVKERTVDNSIKNNQ